MSLFLSNCSTGYETQLQSQKYADQQVPTEQCLSLHNTCVPALPRQIKRMYQEGKAGADIQVNGHCIVQKEMPNKCRG